MYHNVFIQGSEYSGKISNKKINEECLVPWDLWILILFLNARFPWFFGDLLRYSDPLLPTPYSCFRLHHIFL